MPTDDIIPRPAVALANASDVPTLLAAVRPEWQARSLIQRVNRILPVDPSSACQRLFNAAIHDLREKVLVAGLDIANEAARQNRLPPVERTEDVENYSTSKLIDLAYRIGLLSRPDWRRLSRCYEIRRDLEHEDDEYEAGVEDCVYIFKTCVECVLSKDPIQPVRVQDIKDVVEQATPASLSEPIVEDFSNAPDVRQEEILKFLISITLDPEKSDIVQQNSFTAIQRLGSSISNPVRIAMAKVIQDRVGRRTLNMREVRVSQAAEAFAYLRSAQITDFFNGLFSMMQRVGHNWGAYSEHGDLLRTFKEVGGFKFIPAELLPSFVEWCMQCYIGSPGGHTRYGHIRHVFYSNTAAPLIEELFREQSELISSTVAHVAQTKGLGGQMANSHLRERAEELLDMVEADG